MAQFTLDALLDELDSSRERLLVAIEPLPDEALLAPNAVGTWSIADVLANITAWEAETVTGMLKLDQGKRPDALLQALRDPRQYDALRYVENKERDLDQIFDDFQHVRLQLEEWLESFAARDLSDPQRFKALNGRSLADIVALTTYKHELRLVPKVELFAAIWLAQENNTTEDDGNIIPLMPDLPTEVSHDDTD